MDLMTHLDSSRFEPVLVSPGEGPLTEWATYAGVPSRISRDGDWTSRRHLASRIASLFAIIRRERVQVVHAAAPMCYRALGFAGRLAGCVRVCHLGFPPEPGELERSFLNGPDAVIGCYQAQAVDQEAAIHRRRPHCRVVGIPNGIDTGCFVPASSNDVMLSIRAGARHVVAILGHVSEVKGYPAFVEAAALVARAHPDCRFVAVGGETVQPGFTKYLQDRVRELGLGDRFAFLGFRTDVERVLAAVDVVVLPSLSEGFPLAILEAMACGKPVIATSVGGVPEAVADGETGLLVPPGQVGDLAQAIDRLLRNPDLCQRLGRAARDRVQRCFSVELFAARVQTLYDELLVRHVPMSTTTPLSSPAVAAKCR